MEKALEIIRERLLQRVDSGIDALEKKRLEVEQILPKTPKIRFVKRRSLTQQLSQIKEHLELSRKVRRQITSDAFANRLERFEPWKLEEKSVEKKDNLHVNILRGHADPEFKAWVSGLATRHGVDEYQAWAGIAESIRRAQWEAIKHFVEKKGFDRYTLPYNVVYRSPHSAVALLQTILSRAKRNKKLPNLTSREKALDDMGVGGLPIVLDELKQVISERTGGLYSIAASLDQVVGLHSDAVKSAFSDCFSGFTAPTYNQRTLFEHISRETGATLHPELQKLTDAVVPHGDDLAKRVAIEDEFGLKELQEIGAEKLSKLHSQIFAPFLKRLKLAKPGSS